MSLRKKIADKIEKHMSASQIMVVGFAAAILLGGILLSLPVCNADGEWLTFIDALFTSCTAVCVTGLVTIVPATQFSLIGKVVLLILIQLGGLGIIACTMGAFLILHKQITIRSRVMIQETYNMNTLSGLVAMLVYVLKGTFLVEGIGAFLYSFQMIPEYGFFRGIWYAVFHSVSAFCNAGIDLLGDSSLQKYQLNPLMNLATVFLIIVSGLGFIVWQDLTVTLKRIIRRECSIRRSMEKMKLHTKVVLTMTFLLIMVGTIGVYGLESGNPATLKELSVGEKWMVSLFQSVTTRTAGFFTIPQNLFREETKLLSCMLMFAGGSPGGTAGGVKTTTIAILLLNCWSVLKGNEETECFRRKIQPATIRTGFSIFTVAFLTLLIGTIVLITIEQVPMIDALYEVTSAVATVGLTTGITPLLSSAGKILIIVLMYMGRLGPVTLALLFASKVGEKKHLVKLPEERIMVG